ncbi:MAG: radical SAM family heme chaperone HemW [Bacillota bacterium]|nr:radical SAM family heme chaperone HemW [Bacillota bacterium]
MMKTNSLGLYLHIPFCERKCSYCDFLSFKCAQKQPLSEYAVALCEEIKILGETWPYRLVETVFIGGGTPSLLEGEDIKRIMSCIRENFNVAEDAEITIEGNPNSLDDRKLNAYLETGINRLSIGIQSFDNSVLSVLGRLHDKNQATSAYQKARRAGFRNINLDLMFAIPGQSLKKWIDSVKAAVFLKPEHISMYSLTLEEGTEMYDRIKSGQLTETTEILDREMYHQALELLKKEGYEHYEISNCALPGREGRHNMKYWSYEEYLGIGLGASSFIGGVRYRNVENMLDYLKCIKAHKAPIDAGSVENYTERDEMGIFIFTGLRKQSGISLERFRRTFGRDLFDVFDDSVLKRNKGLIVLEGDRLYLTEYGMDVSNRIMAEFV